MFGKCIKDKYLAGGITKLLNESEGMKGWKWSAKNFSQNLFGRVLLGDLQWGVEIDWAQRFFAKCFWSSFLFSFSSVTCSTCLHRQRIQSSAFTDWKFKKRNTIYLTALRSGEWKKHNAQMCFVSFLIQLFLALNLCRSMTLPDVYMIFGVIWGAANEQFYRVVFSPFLVALSSMFWRPLFSRLAENRLRATFCQSQYFETSPIPSNLSSNFHLASPHFTNPVRYLSAPV